MSLVDKTLTCRDCGNQFEFTAGEQEFYQSRGLLNEPGRCPDCRTARRSSRGQGGYGGGSNSGGGSSYDRPRREMYPAVCSSCGKETQVPFQPRGDKPVYCSDCFANVRGEGYR